MDDRGHVAGASEVRNSPELPENPVKTSAEFTNSSSCFKLDCKQANNAIDTSEDTSIPEKRNVIEIVETLVRNKQAHFKSQQRGDPDLSVDEKKTIAKNLFDKSPLGFLSQFGHLLEKKHLDYFHSFKYANDQEREEVSYQLSYLGASRSKSSKTRLKNRRYDALQKMIISGSYFSMEEMQARNPLLFEQLVGKYQTDEERKVQMDDLPTNAEFPWMQHFAQQVEKERTEKFKEQQKLDEAGDEDDSSDESDKQVKKREEMSQLPFTLWGEYRGKFEADNSKKKVKAANNKEKDKKFQNASEEEKAFYLQEFQTAMYHSFLSGNDKDFDYSSVDNNSEYDCVDMRERDEQDQYFDEESPDSISQADMDITEGSQDDLSQFSEPLPVNPDSASKMDEDVRDGGHVCDRLTEDDVQNLKSFASSWANNHSQSESECVDPKRTFSVINSVEMDVSGKTSPGMHRVPVKKNHKIKISLKTKEM